MSPVFTISVVVFKKTNRRFYELSFPYIILGSVQIHKDSTEMWYKIVNEFDSHYVPYTSDFVQQLI